MEYFFRVTAYALVQNIRTHLVPHGVTSGNTINYLAYYHFFLLMKSRRPGDATARSTPGLFPRHQPETGLPRALAAAIHERGLALELYDLQWGIPANVSLPTSLSRRHCRI